MQKITAQQKIKVPQIGNPQEIWKVWKKAWGIWRKKKIDPLKYLKKVRKEWEETL
jgi:hypothetical protein